MTLVAAVWMLAYAHPNLAPRSQICFIYFQEFCLLATGAKSEFLFGKFEEES